MIYLTIFAIFISVALLCTVILYPLLTRRSHIQQRLDSIAPRPEQQFSTSLTREKTPLQTFLARAGNLLPKSPREYSKYTQALISAGYHKESLYVFLGSKIILTAVLPLLFIFFVTMPRGMVFNPQMLLIEVALAISGFLLPTYWLRRKVNYRTREIFHALPDILDLLTICVEAGISIDAALVKTTENPQFKGNPLAEEMKQASMEIRAGKLRIDALKDMAKRTNVDDVKSFVTMLIQTERFGTSLSLALRVHSDSLRTKRRQIAEEAAAKTSVKMLFPLALFVFPAILIVILGPAVISITKAFSK